MITDRELLEAAARAAGIALEWNDSPGYYSDWRGLPQWNHWNPLLDDGDAFRLAVRLGIVNWYRNGNACATCRTDEGGFFDAFNERGGEDPLAATRRAIVRAAAAMGGAE